MEYSCTVGLAAVSDQLPGTKASSLREVELQMGFWIDSQRRTVVLNKKINKLPDHAGRDRNERTSG